MSVAQAVPAVVGEISKPLTWAEICARYPDEWICLVEVDFIHPSGLEFRTARVIGHGKTRHDPVMQARPWRSRYEEIGHLYTGRITAALPRPPLIIDDET